MTSPAQRRAGGQRAVRSVLMRGGTSKGLFFHDADLPPEGPERDHLLVRALGSPHALQLDGLGGGTSSTSKVMVVHRPTSSGEIPYAFGQVSIDSARVDWSGNCGNLTTAVAAFCVDEGLAPSDGSVAVVRLRNVGTGLAVEARVEVDDGVSRADGDFRTPGVPFAGSPIRTLYLDPCGGVLGSAFPTGALREELAIPGGTVEVSILDITHPLVVARAADLGVDVMTPPDELNTDAELLARLEELRAAASVRVGAAADAASAKETSPIVPRFALVEAPVLPNDDLQALGVSMGRVHRGLMMTAALALGGAAELGGTIVDTVRRGKPGTGGLRICTPMGSVDVLAELADGGLRAVGVTRTARRLMAGEVYVPDDGGRHG